MNSHDQSAEGSASRFTRRSVVRAAGTAAWAAPVIVAASAAPAYAGSVGVPDVNASNLLGERINHADPVDPTSVTPARLTISVTYTNIGTAASALTVAITLDPDSGVVTDRIGETPDLTPAAIAEGWVAGASEGTGARRTFVFQRLGGLAAGAASTVQFEVRSTNDIITTTPMGTGTIEAGVPTTTPESALNSGAAGTYPA